MSLLIHPDCTLLHVIFPLLNSPKVNADIKKYKLEKGVPKLFEVDKTTIGKYLSTKAVGSYQREDLTSSVSYSTINVKYSYWTFFMIIVVEVPLYSIALP